MGNDAYLNEKESTADTDAAKTFIIISTGVSKIFRVIESFLKAWSHGIKLIKVNKNLWGKRKWLIIDNKSKSYLATKYNTSSFIITILY